MPFTGWVFDAVFISVRGPSYQKPSRSNLSIRELSVLWAGPKGLAGASPEHFQEPAKYLSCDISGAGLGVCWARAEEATTRRTTADATVVFIFSLLAVEVTAKPIMTPRKAEPTARTGTPARPGKPGHGKYELLIQRPDPVSGPALVAARGVSEVIERSSRDVLVGAAGVEPATTCSQSV